MSTHTPPCLRGLFARLALPLLLVLALCTSAQAAEPLRILAGTALVEDVLLDLGSAPAGLTTRTLIPGSACPGHADLKASDVIFLQGAAAVMIHDWQQDMPLVQALVRTAPGAQAKLRVVAAPGNWMLPDRQAEATRAVSRLLLAMVPAQTKGSGANPLTAKTIEARTKARLGRIQALSVQIRARAARAGLPGTRVICDAMQRPLLEWLGCTVVAEYGRFEGMNPKMLAEVMTKAKAGKAVLVVDNLQSTGGSGKALADDLGAAYTALTNFPGVDARARTWEQALEWNVSRLVAALATAGRR